MKEVRIRLVLFFILFGSFAAVHWKEVAAIGTVINQLPALLRPAKIESIKVPVIWGNIPEINLSTRLVGGFETAYKYTIKGSLDGQSDTMLHDGTDNWQASFQILKIEDRPDYRYLQLNVSRVINVHNNNFATWAEGVYELTAFGTPR